MLEGGVGGGVREALLISLERTNTLSALYVYRDIRYKTTGIIQSGRNLYRNPSFRFKPHQQSRRQLFFIIKMFYTVNHCIVPFDWKQLCGAFFAERRGGALIFILIQGRHSKRPKIYHVSDDVILLINYYQKKNIIEFWFFCKIRAFVI